MEGLKFPTQVIDSLLKEVGEGETLDFDAKKAIQDWQESYDKERLEDSTLIKEKLKDYSEVAIKRAQVEIARGLDLGLSRREAEAADLDDILDAAKKKGTGGGKGDETLKKELADAKARYDSIVDELEAKQEGWNKEKEDLEKTYQSTLKSAKLDSLIERRFGNFNFGVSTRLAEFAKRSISAELKDRYDIDPATGTIKDKDGGTVYDPKDGTKRWKTIDDALSYELEQAEVLKKSNGTDNGSGNGRSREEDNEPEETQEAKSLRERYEAAQNK